MFEVVENTASGTVIKVIGVGGAGGNAVDHMIRNGVAGVGFITANTDGQALSRTQAKSQIQLGSTGLGAGAKPEAGRAAALEAREQKADALRGPHTAFTNPGMAGAPARAPHPWLRRSPRRWASSASRSSPSPSRSRACAGCRPPRSVSRSC